MTKETFISLLKSHDWYYQYTNGEAYSKGKIEHERINAAKRDNPELQNVYDEYLEARKSVNNTQSD